MHGKSDNIFVLHCIFSIHGDGLKKLTLGGYISGFVHIILSVKIVKLVSYEQVEGHCYPLTFLKHYPHDRNFPNKSTSPSQSNNDFMIQNCY